MKSSGQRSGYKKKLDEKEAAQANPSPGAKRLKVDAKQIYENLQCPITNEIFFDPIRVEPSKQHYERDVFYKWYKEHNTDPMTRQKIEKVEGPDHTFLQLMNANFNAFPEINSARYFKLSILQDAINSENERVLNLFIELFKISPERLVTVSEEEGHEHTTALILISRFKPSLLRKLIPIIPHEVLDEALNNLIPGGPHQGKSVAYYLCRFPKGRKLLAEDKALRGKISPKALNNLILEGPVRGLSAVFFLCGNTDGLKLLVEDKVLRDKISPEALNNVIADGPHQGTSAAYFLCQETEGLKLLAEDKALRDKISPEALNRFIPDEPDKDKSAAFFLCALPEGRKLLAKDKALRDKISSEALNKVIPDGPGQGAGTSAAYFLCGSSEGRKLLAEDKALRDKISPEALNYVIPDGPYQGISAAYYLCRFPEGLKLLAEDKVLRDKISPEYLNKLIPAADRNRLFPAAAAALPNPIQSVASKRPHP